MRSRKILRGSVFYILFCIVFLDISGKGKHAAAQNFTHLIKSKLIVLKLIIDRKLKLLQGINCI